MPSSQQGIVITDSGQILPGVIENADLATDAVSKVKVADSAIASAEIEDDSIVNADIAATAAISDTKLAQIATADKIADTALPIIPDNKLATLDNAGLVDGAALTGLANIPAGAGVIPAANLAAKYQSFFAKITGTTNNLTGEENDELYLSFPDGSATQGHATFFMPSGATISSIQLVCNQAGGSNAENFVADFRFRSKADSVADQTDNALTQVITDLSGLSTIQLITIPATAYDGLTTGRWWSLKFTRQGAHASDTLTNALRCFGLIINLA